MLKNLLITMLLMWAIAATAAWFRSEVQYEQAQFKHRDESMELKQLKLRLVQEDIERMVRNREKRG